MTRLLLRRRCSWSSWPSAVVAIGLFASSAGAQTRPAPTTQATENEPDSPRTTAALYELGVGLAQAGYLRAAAEAFEQFDRTLWETHPEQRRAGEIAPLLEREPYGMIERRLELLKRLGERDECARTAAWALAIWPDDGHIERLYARTLLDAEQAAAAFEFCRQRLEAESAGSTSPPTAQESHGGSLLNSAIKAARAADRFGGWVAQLRANVAQGRQLALAARLARRLDEMAECALAVPLWRALAAAQPDSVDVAWALANALKQSDDLAGALSTLIEFVRKNPDLADLPPQRLAAWLRSFKVSDEFLRLVADFSARPDCDFATYTVLGTTAAAAGQAELAERLFRAALQNRPDFALAHVAWGRTALAAYRWDEAKAQAEQALAAAADLPAAHLLLADAFAGLDESKDAEREYKAALERRSDDMDYLLAVARFYRQSGNLLAAARYFQQAWALDHTRTDAIEELIDCYLEGSKVEIARAQGQAAEAADLPEDVLRRIRTALRYADAPLQAEHLAELRKQFESHPADSATGLKLAAGLFRNDRAEEALKILECVQAVAPDDERGLYLLARVQMRRLETARAVPMLEEMARRYPRRFSALRLLADAYLMEFRLPELRETLQRILALDLTPEQRAQQRAQMLASYLDFGEFDAALRLVEDWIAQEPEEDGWVRAKLRVLLSAGRREEAVELATARLKPTTEQFFAARRAAGEAEAALRRRAEDRDAQAKLLAAQNEVSKRVTAMFQRRAEYVQVCMEAKHLVALEHGLETWLGEGPRTPVEDVQVRQWLVEVLLAQKHGDEALQVLSKAELQTTDDLVRIQAWRARAHAAEGRLEDGLRELRALLHEKYVQADLLSRVQVRQEIINLLVQAREYDQAVRTCDGWLTEIDERDRLGRYEVLVLKCSVLQKAERTEEYIAVAEELLKLQPHHPGLNNDLAYTWVDRGEQVDRAISMLTLAVAAEPVNSAFLDSLGWAYYKKGDFDAARAYLSRAVRLQGGQDAVVRDHLGDTEYRLGDRTAAREHWQKALTLAEEPPDDERPAAPAQLMATLRSKLGALERSETAPVAATADTAVPREREAVEPSGRAPAPGKGKP